jgi:transposase-like protein
VGWKMRKQVAADLKPIYQSAATNEAEHRLTEFEAQWNDAYPDCSDMAAQLESDYSVLRLPAGDTSHRLHD